MKVTVTHIEDMVMPGASGKGNLRAYASIQIGPLVIHKVKLVKQPGQKPYVTPPQFEFFRDGHVQYQPIVKWPQDWHQQIFDAVWSAYCALPGRAGNTSEE